MAVMTCMGNYIANCLWEARLQPGLKKPGPDTPREEKERFIKAKYERKEWLATLPAPHSSAQALVDAICRCDIAEVSLALAHSSLEEVNSCVSPRDARTPLHLAAALGNLPITQLLIWANANLGATDHDGRTCVSHARSSGAMDVVSLLLAAGCPESAPGGTLPRRRGSGEMRHRGGKEVASSVL
jgi:Arf-GAP/GTPase/ANK repeat/PH domain-containing protein 1/3